MTCNDASHVLYSVFSWGTPDKDESMKLDQFLTEKLGYAKTKFRNSFNTDQREVISRDPACRSFDVTLLVIAVLMGCKGLRTPFPYVPSEEEFNLKELVIKVKEFRNSLAHLHPFTMEDQVFTQNADELRDLLRALLEVAAKCYGVDNSILKEKIEYMIDSVNRSRYDSLESQDIYTYENSIFLQGRQKILTTEGKSQLVDKYMVFDHISPVLFYTDKNIHLEVGLIFTHMEIVESRSSDCQELIAYEDLLEFVQRKTIDKGSKTDILFIEGIAGAGKTTLTRIMTCEWRNQQSSMQNLLEYDLLIYFECRNSAIHSFKQLLETLMSDVLPKFKEGDLVTCVLTLKLLIIADGLDELNQSSTKVFQEILDLGTLAVITIVCTSRPEYVKKFYALVPEGQCVTHVRIKGIPSEKRTDFVERYHEELKRKGVTEKEVDGLITFMRDSSNHLEEPLRLPLNLAWLTIMWSLSPERLIKVTGATELYTEILGLNKERLVNRLKMTEAMSCDGDLTENLDRFLLFLSWEALISLKEQTIDSLPKDSVDRLRNACSSLRLPYEPVLSTFLIETIVYDTTRTKSVFSIAHKGELDYLAANYVIEALNGKDLRFDITSIMRSIESHPSYQNESLREELIEHILSRLKASLTRGVREEVHDKAGESRVLVGNENHPRITTIIGVLEGLYGTDRIPSDLSRYQNMFQYVAGLFHRVPNTIRKEIGDELVSLFHKSGVSKDQWHDLLAETKMNEDIAKSIATKICSLGEGNANITDSRSLNIYSKLVPHGNYAKITVNLTDSAENNQRLDELFTNMTEKKNCPLQIYLHHHFRNAGTTSHELDVKLRRLFERGNVNKFMGWLSGETSQLLKPTVVGLWLQLDERNAGPVIEVLSHLKDQAKGLENLCVHVVPGLDPGVLAPLPGGVIVDLILYLSDIDDQNVEWATQVAKALQPADGRKAFGNILIPRSRLTPDGLMLLVEHMGRYEVCIRGVFISDMAVYSDRIFPQDHDRLKDFTRQVLKCDLRFSESEEKLWPKSMR